MHQRIEQRIHHLVALADKMMDSELLEAVVTRTATINPFFTTDFIHAAIRAIAEEMLDRQKLNTWLAAYDLPEHDAAATVGIIMAGNIPLVGFHDFLCVYILGNPMQIKLSGKDDLLFPVVFDMLCKLDTSLPTRAQIVEKLHDYDAVIATGSNNSYRYFEYYFRDKPKILRKNRNSVAVLTGGESDADLAALADDIFMYFGFGCRNVSKLYVPEDYDITKLFPHFDKYQWMFHHTKYMNNYDYNRTILLLNNTPHLANDIVMIQEQSAIASPVSMLYYERYSDLTRLKETLLEQGDHIQCVVGPDTIRPLVDLDMVPFGASQKPSLVDYADGVDILTFLKGL
ncbi:MAG: acyl-CoA reductase [Bacteroidetes bacterium]|nr:acyl-CoA reductase [Bacteroidota bacterium]